MADPVVEVERRIAATPDEVFTYLTDPEKYTRWKGQQAELDPRPGGRYRVRMGPEAVALGEYVEVEPPSRVVFTWGWEGSGDVPPGSTTVEITLHADGDGTLLRLRHTGFPSEADADLHREGWQMYVGRLVEVAAGAQPDVGSGPAGVSRP
ncbi:MAG TPA: SRPBCC domain-containing protein [Actinomycetota bacterium]|nr:SRPBCC domain-containing protein [Actinomycetota bacterium]